MVIKSLYMETFYALCSLFPNPIDWKDIFYLTADSKHTAFNKHSSLWGHCHVLCKQIKGLTASSFPAESSAAWSQSVQWWLALSGWNLVFSLLGKQSLVWWDSSIWVCNMCKIQNMCIPLDTVKCVLQWHTYLLHVTSKRTDNPYCAWFVQRSP